MPHHSGNQPGSLDKNNSICREINEHALAWALENADAEVRSRYEKEGVKLASYLGYCDTMIQIIVTYNSSPRTSYLQVIVDDQQAPIGLTGPTWIKKELVYDDKNATLEVQSWSFVVGNTNHGHVPWIIPAGMHYCKLLSPARAMEWIYTYSLHGSLSWK